MKKSLLALVIFTAMFSIANAGYYYDGGPMGMCDDVNRNNPQTITFAGFWPYPIANSSETTYVRQYNADYYAVRTLIIGYPSTDNSLATIDGQYLDWDMSYFVCNTSQYLSPYAVGAHLYGSSYFYGGRSREWLIHRKALRPGANNVVFDLEGHSYTLTINVK